MKKFEYTTTACTIIKEDEMMAAMGKNGWELCGVILSEPQIIDFYWKRALPESNDKTETK